MRRNSLTGDRVAGQVIDHHAVAVDRGSVDRLTRSFFLGQVLCVCVCVQVGRGRGLSVLYRQALTRDLKAVVERVIFHAKWPPWKG